MRWPKWYGGASSRGPGGRRAPVSRRAFLGGAGAVLTLPLLESLRVSAAPPAAGPVRLVFWYAPDGIVMDQYRPGSDGPLGVLPRLLQPLELLKSEVTVLGGLENKAAEVPVAGDHARGTGSFLTCATVEHTAAENIANGISADQVAANALDGATLFKSLELGTTGGASVGDCDSGYSCAYSRNISWIDAQTPNPKLTDPSLLFDRLFAGFDGDMTAQQVAQRKAWRTSVVDHVLDEANSLHARVSHLDQQKLDQFLSGVRDLEVRIQADQQVCVPGDRPASGLDYPTLVRAMTDLTVLAFSCDLTRVVTFMLENGGSYRSWDFIGVPEAHHDLSHHDGDPTKIEKLAQIDTWEINEFGYLLDRLNSVQDVDGNSLLHNSLCTFSSEISDGNRHNHDDLPMLLAGRGGGYVATTGRNKTFDHEPIANLYLAMIEAQGASPGTFGLDGTHPIDLG